ncbi:DMT family transporter [Hymenobacter canadensis]|uniref:DMT family transporter n=1 Tax=Hymenobacter canadensis TaxID=2999067 RepID=A0ABY7LNK4_9BACT|nr:DMT family transporter [Hymenobacter canadensis]WBA41517.1 DMT family transporter [Hymenobacter canadensis]
MLTPGVRYMLLSTLAFALLNVCVKMLPHLPPLEIIFFRSVLSLALSYGALRQLRVRPWGEPGTRFYLVSRGATGALGLALYFYTLQVLPLASAVTLQYLAPIFTAILGIFLVKEQVRPWQWVFFLVSFAGVVVVKGVDTRIAPLYLALSVASGLCAGLAYNAIRRLGNRAHPLVTVLYSQLVVLPFCAAYCLLRWTTPVGWHDWGLLLLIGLLTQVSQVYKTKAYQAGSLASISSLDYLGLVYALGLGYTFFGETFGLPSYLGMALVLLGVALNAAYAYRQARRPLPVVEEIAA